MFEINGEWAADYLVSGSISKNGGTPTNLNLFKNIENNNPRRPSISGIARPLLKPLQNQQKENQASILTFSEEQP